MAASTQLSHGNCFFGILYLFLRGKVHEIVGISTKMWWWPIHFMALTKHGIVLHFQHDHVGQEFAPVWHLGRYIGFSQRRQRCMLEKSGRKIKFRTRRVGWVMLLILAWWCVLVVPFGVTMFGMIFVWNFKWSVEAVSHRKQRI